MTTVIPDGTYHITSLSPTGATLYLDLYGGKPFGAITIARSVDSDNQEWEVTNVGSTGNRIILQSIADEDTYASAYSKTVGSGIGGSPNVTIWTVSRAGRDYVLKTVVGDREHPWLTTGNTGATVVLGKVDDQPARWSFTPVE